MRIVWVGTANDQSYAVSDRSRSVVRTVVAMMWSVVRTVVWTMVAVVWTVVTGLWSGVAAVMGSAMGRELFPMRVQFPARVSAGGDVPHEANVSLRTGLNRHQFRRTLPVGDGDPELLALVDGSYSLAFDEQVVGS